MRLALVTPPASEPLALADAKVYLRIDNDEDDDEVADAIGAARLLCENEIDRSFIETDWDLHLDDWPEWNDQLRARVIFLPRADALAVEEVVYIATDGAETTLDPADYKVALGAPARIAPAYGTCWPSARSEMDAIRVRFTAGYGDAAEDVPLNVKQAIKLTLAYLYENRGEVVAQPPPAACALLAASHWGQYA